LTASAHAWHRRGRAIWIAALAVAAVWAPGVVDAQTVSSETLETSRAAQPPASWYVVGDIDRTTGLGAPSAIDAFAAFGDRLMVGDEERRRIALGLTFSNTEADRALTFTAPSPSLDGDAEDRFTFLVSGAYDWHTGTIVTPRFMAGVGVSYLDPDATPSRLSDGHQGSDVTPAMQVGIGADVAVSGALDLSAEYRASVRGASDTNDTERDPQVDQKFMLGAKIRF